MTSPRSMMQLQTVVENSKGQFPLPGNHAQWCVVFPTRQSVQKQKMVGNTMGSGHPGKYATLRYSYKLCSAYFSKYLNSIQRNVTLVCSN